MLHHWLKGCVRVALLFVMINGVQAGEAPAEKKAEEKKSGDVSFSYIPEISGLSAQNCDAPVLATYTIQNNLPIEVTIGAPTLISQDFLATSAVTVSPTTTCGSRLSPSGSTYSSCDITLSFQPCEGGEINRILEVCVLSTTQGCKLTAPVQAEVAPSAMMAGGQYISGGTLFPMIAVSADGGNTWDYTIEENLNLPTDYNDFGNFNSVNCTGLTCLAGGQYFDDTIGNTTYFPMLAVSLDGGNTWGYKIEENLTLPTDYDNNSGGQKGNIESVDCSGQVCIAVGGYTATSNKFPMLALSSDGGNAWSYAIEADLNLPSFYSSINSVGFSSASCSGQICVAGGQYFSVSNNFPMLAVSVDGGNNWDYAVEENVTLPNDYDDFGNFYSVDCSGQICVAGGQYFSVSNNFPMLAVSSDGGNTWDYAIEAGLNLPLDYEDMVTTGFSASCSGQTCIAGGAYLDNTTHWPMIAISTDGGNNWNYTIEKNLNLPAEFDGTAVNFNSVNCSGQTCVAGGLYITSANITYPMLAVSSDRGNSWEYVIEAGLNLPTDFNNNGAFNSVSCSGQTCMAGGQYTDDTHTQFPMLAVSLDKGNTWEYVVEKNLTLPTDYQYEGVFDSVTTANNNNLLNIEDPFSFSAWKSEAVFPFSSALLLPAKGGLMPDELKLDMKNNRVLNLC